MSVLRETYDLEPHSKQVWQLTELVKRTETAMTEDIIKIIEKDEAMVQKTLRLAYPSRDDLEDLELEMAVNRLGTGIVLILVMSDIVHQAVMKTFDTMIGVSLTPADPSSRIKEEQLYLRGSVNFTGQAAGKVYLHFPFQLGQKITSKLLGMSVDELGHEIVKDSMGEFVNIITGNLQSNLGSAGIQCKISLPTVIDIEAVAVEKIPGMKQDVQLFEFEEDCFWLHFLIDPYGD